MSLVNVMDDNFGEFIVTYSTEKLNDWERLAIYIDGTLKRNLSI